MPMLDTNHHCFGATSLFSIVTAYHEDGNYLDFWLKALSLKSNNRTGHPQPSQYAVKAEYQMNGLLQL